MKTLAGMTSDGMVVSSTKFIRTFDRLISKAIDINQEFMNAEWGYQARPLTMAAFRSYRAGGELILHMARWGMIHQPLVRIEALQSGLSVVSMIVDIDSEDEVDADTIGSVPWRDVTDIVGATEYSILKDSKWLKFVDRMSRNAVEAFCELVINDFLK